MIDRGDGDERRSVSTLCPGLQCSVDGTAAMSVPCDLMFLPSSWYQGTVLRKDISSDHVLRHTGPKHHWMHHWMRN
jgi:hypothetical protein